MTKSSGNHWCSLWVHWCSLWIRFLQINGWSERSEASGSVVIRKQFSCFKTNIEASISTLVNMLWNRRTVFELQENLRLRFARTSRLLMNRDIHNCTLKFTYPKWNMKHLKMSNVYWKKVQKARNSWKYRTIFVAKIWIFAQKTKIPLEWGARIEERFPKKYQNTKKWPKSSKIPGITP